MPDRVLSRGIVLNFVGDNSDLVQASRGAERAIGRYGRRAGQAGDQSRRLNVAITGLTTRFRQLAGLAVGAFGISNLVQGLRELGQESLRLTAGARALGVYASEVGGLAAAYEAFNLGSAADVLDDLRDIQERIAEAPQGLAEAFDRAGLSLQRLNADGVTAIDQFTIILERMRELNAEGRLADIRLLEGEFGGAAERLFRFLVPLPRDLTNRLLRQPGLSDPQRGQATRFGVELSIVTRQLRTLWQNILIPIQRTILPLLRDFGEYLADINRRLSTLNEQIFVSLRTALSSITGPLIAFFLGNRFLRALNKTVGAFAEGPRKATGVDKVNAAMDKFTSGGFLPAFFILMRRFLVRLLIPILPQYARQAEKIPGQQLELFKPPYPKNARSPEIERLITNIKGLVGRAVVALGALSIRLLLLRTALDALSAGIGALALLGSTARETWEELWTIERVLTTIYASLVFLPRAFVQTLSSLRDGIVSGVSTAWVWVVDAVSSGLDSIGSFFTGLMEKMSNAIQELTDGVNRFIDIIPGLRRFLDFLAPADKAIADFIKRQREAIRAAGPRTGLTPQIAEEVGRQAGPRVAEYFLKNQYKAAQAAGPQTGPNAPGVFDDLNKLWESIWEGIFNLRKRVREENEKDREKVATTTGSEARLQFGPITRPQVDIEREYRDRIELEKREQRNQIQLLTTFGSDRRAALEAEFRVSQDFLQRRQQAEARLRDASADWQYEQTQYARRQIAAQRRLEKAGVESARAANVARRGSDQLTHDLQGAFDTLRQTNREYRETIRQINAQEEKQIEAAKQQEIQFQQTLRRAQLFNQTITTIRQSLEDFSVTLISSIREWTITLENFLTSLRNLGNRIANTLTEALVTRLFDAIINKFANSTLGATFQNWIFRILGINLQNRTTALAEQTQINTWDTANNTADIAFATRQLNDKTEQVRAQIEACCNMIVNELKNTQMAIREAAKSQNDNNDQNTGGLASVLALGTALSAGPGTAGPTG